MDRDYFLRRHDEEVARAAEATCDEARAAHEGLARRFKEAADRVGSPSTVEASDWNERTRAA